MELLDLLEFIMVLADKKGMSKPYIVGGVPRDKLLKRFNDLGDIDITTGDSSVHYLAKEAAIILKSDITSYHIYPDGHARLYVGEFDLDFSTNFKIPKVKNQLLRMGIKNTDSMTEELYSRDFTCNTALLTLDLKKMYDPTGRAIPDIKAKVLRTCLDPELTLGHDNNRIMRAIYFAAKLGFEVDDSIISWVKNNPDVITNIKPNYFAKKIREALSFDQEKTRRLIDKMGMWKHVSHMPEFFKDIQGRPTRI
jgi:tRNA nucleotidyltransferase (CCA-adding enzyme)